MDTRGYLFFPYFGGKGSISKYYPKPRYKTIVEPFAGGAGYSLRYPAHEIILVEKDPKVASLWKWLVKATRDDILSIPLDIQDTGEDKRLGPEQRTLVELIFGLGVGPRRRRRRAKGLWTPRDKTLITRLLTRIRHWHVFEGDYTLAASTVGGPATWFVDPPYHKSGKLYTCSSRDLCFNSLGQWCLEREGQVIVCEQKGAEWLPFEPLVSYKTSLAGKNAKGSRIGEVVWLSDGNYRKRAKGLQAL